MSVRCTEPSGRSRVWRILRLLSWSLDSCEVGLSGDPRRLRGLPSGRQGLPPISAPTSMVLVRNTGECGCPGSPVSPLNCLPLPNASVLVCTAGTGACASCCRARRPVLLLEVSCREEGGCSRCCD